MWMLGVRGYQDECMMTEGVRGHPFYINRSEGIHTIFQIDNLVLLPIYWPTTRQLLTEKVRMMESTRI